MVQIGRRIFFDVQTGNVLVDTGERQGFVVPTTMEQDILTFKILSEILRETFDVLELKYGQYAQDFAECNGYRVNVDTLTLEFSYPDPNQEEPQEPVYQAPLSEKVIELETRTADVELALADIMLGGM